MTPPYPIGSRVVCSDPAGRRFVGTVAHVHNCGDLTVTDGVAHVRASVEEVRPVMPRDRRDLVHGQWWWLGDRPVWVTSGVPSAWSYTPTWREGCAIDPKHNWRGPVQPPPEVR